MKFDPSETRASHEKRREATDWLSCLVRVSLLDAEDMLYEFAKHLTQIPQSPSKGILTALKTPIGLLANFIRAIGSKTRNGGIANDPWRQPIWVIATTQNQAESLRPICHQLQESCHGISAPNPQDISHPTILFALSFCLYPVALWHMSKVSALALSARFQLLYLYCCALGEGVILDRRIRHYRPKLLVVANDHSVRNRVAMALARNAGVKVVYVQHAAIGGIEPPLNAMDVALLHGVRSLEIYHRIGPISAKVYCVGAAKLDGLQSPLPSSTATQHIAICPSLLDDIQNVQRTLQAIAEKCHNVTFILRIHPRADHPTQWRQMAQDLNFAWSDAARETVRELVAQCNLMVVSDSNIGLEAMALGCPAIMTMFGAPKRDPYGFVTEGLYAGQCAATDEELKSLLTETLTREIHVRPNLTRHFANLGTPYQGRAAELAAAAIRTEASGRRPPEDLFREESHHGILVCCPAPMAD